MSVQSETPLSVGAELPPLKTPPLTRGTLALYAGASGDHNLHHIDLDYARDVAGMPDVFGHGMLTMAYAARMVTNWAPQETIRSLSVRFASIAWIRDELTTRGHIAEVLPDDTVRIEIVTTDQAGDVKLVGHAIVAMGSNRGTGS